MNVCECGCGATIGPRARFQRGHNRKRPLKGPEPVAPNPSGKCLCGCGEDAPIARQTSTRDGLVIGQPMRFRSGHSSRLTPREQTSQWRGGTTNRDGYRLRIKPEGHPAARKYVMEHRLVMEETLGRYLQPHENVHHKNGIRDDNRPENLELWVKPQMSGQRVADLVEWEWVVREYPDLVRDELRRSAPAGLRAL